ncbi:MAG TPA: hypothetical protein VMN56_08210 [Casimicrobiaceae bacterium]|nr:hypothetical protein [Casimicrobiaceae bacterium]
MQIFRHAALLAFAAVLAACAPAQPEFVRPAGSATYPPTQFVDMLDAPPSRPYQEIGVIEVPGEAGALRAQVLAQIRTKAQEIGAQAVILTDLSRPAPVTQRLNPTTGQMETVGGQTIPAFRGVAIRYR